MHRCRMCCLNKTVRILRVSFSHKRLFDNKPHHLSNISQIKRSTWNILIERKIIHYSNYLSALNGPKNNNPFLQKSTHKKQYLNYNSQHQITPQNTIIFYLINSNKHQKSPQPNTGFHSPKFTKTRRQIKSMFFNSNFAQSHRVRHFKRTQTLFIIILNNRI